MKNFTTQFNNLLNDIEEALKAEINKSEIKSEHVNSNAIKVDVSSYVELTIVNSELTFIDDNGLHYSMYNNCSIEDLIDILTSLNPE